MLATRFASAYQMSSREPITDDQLRRVAPSIFAAEAHESRSARYTYVPTIDVVTALRTEGFEPFYACQARTRVEGKRDFTRHMLRLRHASQITSSEVPEVILVNSHDGSSGYQMIAGMFRFVCSNGMVCGTSVDEIRIHHKGDIVGQVIEGAFTVLDEFDRVRESTETMKALTLSTGEQNAFAHAALIAKYGENENDAYPITEKQVLMPHRAEDRGTDLWRTLNVTQEHLVRGGLRGRSANGRRTTTRAVRGISENVQLNRALWTLADEMAKLKAA